MQPIENFCLKGMRSKSLYSRENLKIVFIKGMKFFENDLFFQLLPVYFIYNLLIN